MQSFTNTRGPSRRPAKFHPEAIGERTSAAMQHKASQGDYIGGDVPCGYKPGQDGERLEADEQEQLLVAEARNLRGTGLSLRAVARELQA
jgi:DNA invertase Pin-like site-specific DNA recombinase